MQVDVEPARAGINQVHVYYTGTGALAVDVEEVTARLVSETGESRPGRRCRATASATTSS